MNESFFMKYIFLFSLFSIIVASCTDPQVIGLEVQPESDKISISSLDDSNPFSLATKSADSVRTDEPLVALLGSYESSNFKDVSASFSTQLLLSQNAVDFGASPVHDSAILSLVYSSYYGDTTIEMGIKIEHVGVILFAMPLKKYGLWCRHKIRLKQKKLYLTNNTD